MAPLLTRRAVAGPAAPARRRSPTAFDNGYRRADGQTATTEIARRAATSVPPAPWANVIANPRGGFLVTERGGGFTWAENSYFYRLTPWHNDPVSDPVSEVLYLQDAETGELWSADAGAGPRATRRYTVRHGAGPLDLRARARRHRHRAHARHGRTTRR